MYILTFQLLKIVLVMTIKMLKFFKFNLPKNFKFYFGISIAIIHLDILLVSKLKVQITILKGVLVIVLVS